MSAEIGELRRGDKADLLLFAAMGAAAPYSEEASQHVQDLVDELRASPTGDAGSSDHLLNPHAETDWQALGRLGNDPKQTVLSVTRVKREEASDGR